jgi:hypothetical protein
MVTTPVVTDIVKFYLYDLYRYLLGLMTKVNQFMPTPSIQIGSQFHALACTQFLTIFPKQHWNWNHSQRNEPEE